MPFLSDTEDFVLAMDMTGYGDGHFTDHDLDMLFDAGIRTLLVMDIDWNKLEPAKGKYDWSSLDAYMERATRHGFKVLVECYHDTIKWGSDHWYVWSVRGIQKNWISPFNREGVEYMFGFYRKMKERYTTPTSLVINSWAMEGEFLLPDCQIRDGAGQYQLPDREIHEMFTWMMVEQTRILGDNPWNDVWLMLHPHHVPDEWLEEIIAKYAGLGYNVNWLLYTWKTWVPIWPFMDMLRDKYHLNMFGGAEWAEGIVDTTSHALVHGLRGLLCGPCHPFLPYKQVEPWMVSEIQKSITMFQGR